MPTVVSGRSESKGQMGFGFIVFFIYIKSAADYLLRTQHYSSYDDKMTIVQIKRNNCLVEFREWKFFIINNVLPLLVRLDDEHFMSSSHQIILLKKGQRREKRKRRRENVHKSEK